MLGIFRIKIVFEEGEPVISKNQINQNAFLTLTVMALDKYVEILKKFSHQFTAGAAGISFICHSNFRRMDQGQTHIHYILKMCR